MARRARRRRASNPLSQWGYPSSKQLRREAGQIANAAVPTVRSVQRPYKSQQKSVSGWLDAVLGALSSSSGQAQQAYTQANTQQAAIDAAAQQRLSSLGLGSYAPGVQAAQGAVGDSAAGNLVARGAAAEEYSSRQPGVATGYANVQHNTISKALEDALSQRMDERRAAYGQAIQTVQANALNRANFLAGRQDAAQSFSLQRQGLALQQAQFGESQREFDLSRSDNWAQFNSTQAQNNKQFRGQMIAQYGYDPVKNKFVQGSGGSQSLADSMGITQNELYGMQKSAAGDGRDFFQKSGEVPSYAQMRSYLSQSYDPRVADAVAVSIYANPPKPPTLGQVAGVDPKNRVYAQTPAGQLAKRNDLANYAEKRAVWQAQMKRYSTVINAFNHTIWTQQYGAATSSGPNKGAPWLNKAG